MAATVLPGEIWEILYPGVYPGIGHVSCLCTQGVGGKVYLDFCRSASLVKAPYVREDRGAGELRPREFFRDTSSSIRGYSEVDRATAEVSFRGLEKGHPVCVLNSKKKSYFPVSKVLQKKLNVLLKM